MTEEQFFVQIRDPVDVRRSILGSSKQIIQVLQRYERIKILRVKKLEKIAKLRALNKEINLLVAKLKKEFPEAEMRVRIGKEEKATPRKKGIETRGSELAKLESELRMIEDKIGRLA
ncbi:hypothetical protein KY359_00165 [Candidatus Woesearchaeota archaeon]|nr:hypothetical protein [Candidatus Woesearchaeota archaeon]